VLNLTLVPRVFYRYQRVCRVWVGTLSYRKQCDMSERGGQLFMRVYKRLVQTAGGGQMRQ